MRNKGKTQKGMKSKIIWVLFIFIAISVVLGAIGKNQMDEYEASLNASTASPTESISVSSNTKEDKLDSSNLSVHFIDVGQGDATLIESDGYFMLIDAGENNQGDVVTSYLREHGVEKLDYIIGTHPHSDHIGGLIEVINSFDIETIIFPEKEHTTKTFEDVLDAIIAKDLQLTKPAVGDVYQLGNAEFTIIAPNSDYKDDLNNWSVGVKLTFGSNSFVFTGDSEMVAEYDICDNGIDISADVLHAGHHGSDTSNSQALFKAVNPKYIVISCGTGNSYGHPHQEINIMFSVSGRIITELLLQ